MISGGRILVEVLKAHDIDRIFCVAGESYLPVLDALVDFPEIEVVTCRHESGATYMAEAYAHLSGKPGVAFVTRGPGACNGSIGIHAARQSSAPVILFVGLINTMDRDRESFQEFDVAQMYASLSKWSSVIDRTERMADYVCRAMHVSMSGRPGPVVLGLPEEVLTNEIDKPPVIPVPRAAGQVNKETISAICNLLSQSKKPLILAGGSLWSDIDCALLAKFAEGSSIPVVSALRRQDNMDHNHACYIGEVGFGPNPALVRRVKEADTVLVLGSRIDEITAQGYTLFEPHQKLIHVYPSAEEFGRTYVPHMSVVAAAGTALSALDGQEIDGHVWEGWCAEGREAYLAWTDIPEEGQSDWNGADMTQVFRQLREVLPEDAIVTSDAGNFSGWCHRYLRFGRPGRALAPVSGAMGYTVPAAVAASIAHPERVVVGVSGDGGFMMTGQELATAIHHGAKPIIIVCNNSMYGTIRMHQERDYPGRVSGTALTNPDFVKLGESYGAYTARIKDASQFADVWQEAVNGDRPALIEIVMDQRQISTTSKL